MEAVVEVEDDVFFADLSKRISLLIMDDDEESVPDNCPSVTLQAFTRATHPATQMQILQPQTCTRESKGTGVFIPRSSRPRSKNRQGRHVKFHKHSDNSRGLPQVGYNNNNSNAQVGYNNNNSNGPYDSIYPRRF